jgi:hypothetical protein
MIILLLVLSGLVAALCAVSILGLQQYRIARGVVTVSPHYNGPAEVSATLHVIIRYLLKRSVYMRKFMMQYVAHLAVRVMYYLDKLSSYLYGRSRNWFVRNAVRNRGTVPHFWNHLKVYKQEMDKEREFNDE